MRITVVGTGYVGLVAGTCFAETGNEVVGLDVNEEKIRRLAAGETPIYEPGLADLLRRNLAGERLRFTTSYDEAAAHGRVFFLCLPTPPNEDGSADTRHVLAAVRAVGERAAPDSEPLLVMKSTVPIGTCRTVKKNFAALFPHPFAVASNPEFLKEGAAVHDFLYPDRVVVGVEDERSWKIMRELYEPFVRSGAPILRMNLASAELTKYACNGFLATKISFMNEVARLCTKIGADVEAVRRGMTLDPRIGKAFLYPGIGYGGSCFPKDTRALVASARAHGTDATVVAAAEAVNQTQKTILLPPLREHFGGSLEGRTFALWGLAFKPRTDDIREAPALNIIETLLKEGASIRAYDPEAAENVRALHGDKIFLARDRYEALENADALLLLTEWNEFRAPNWNRVKELLRNPVLFDGRNIYDPQRLRALGFEYYGVGRP